MTDLTTQLDELERLEREATDAPWTTDYDDNGFYLIMADGAPSPYIVATGSEGELNEANAALIAAMRNALPALLSRLRTAPPAPAIPEDVKGLVERLREPLRIELTPVHEPSQLSSQINTVRKIARIMQERAEAAAALSRAAPSWLPMDETAKDGNLILALNSRTKRRAVVGWYNGDWTDVGSANAEATLFFNGDYFDLYMPLPPPPASKNEAPQEGRR